MDLQTVAAYTTGASAFAARYQELTPGRLYTLARAHFHPGEPTADLGCGSGRDAAWLTQEGYPTTGYDASAGMLEQARSRYPHLDLRQDQLPALATIPDTSYANLFSSAVLMHLPEAALVEAALTFARVLRPGGRLVLSYRSPPLLGDREADGRLFTHIPPGKLTLLLEAVGLRVLTTHEEDDPTRPGIRWYALAAEKGPLDVARGLERIQAVLARDRKTATYKFALVRALCVLARTHAHLTRWGEGVVYVPLWSVAVQWLASYWPLLTGPDFVAQKHGERPTDPKPLAFRRVVAGLAETYGAGGLFALLQQLDATPEAFRPALQSIAQTIREGPIRHSGGEGSPVFGFVPRAGSLTAQAGVEGSLGWVVVPTAVWLDLSRFDHWIEDSVILRWARLTAAMNGDERLGAYLALLLHPPAAARDTAEARTLLEGAGIPRVCVWSGRPLATRYDVDHVVPYAAWGNNDLWNLLPCDPMVNRGPGGKFDRLPSRNLLLRRREVVVDYWRQYAHALPTRFATQARRALGADLRRLDWEHVAFAGLQAIVERLATSRGLERWEP